MRLVSIAVLFVALTATAASAQPAPAPAEANWTRYPDAREVQLRDVAAYVRVVPQDRADVAIAISNPGPLPGPEIRAQRDRLVVDGRLRRAVQSCDADGRDEFEVNVRRYGVLHGANLPTIDVRVPRNAVVSVGGAVRLQVGRSDTLRLGMDGCGDADVDAVAGDADIAISGTSDLRLYEARTARVALAGPGDVVLGAVRAGLTASIAGSGDLTAAHVSGPTSIAIQGSGDVTIRGGRATPLSVVIAGSGDVIHNGEAQRLDVTMVGSGDVRVRRVEGEINRRVLGSGEVVVGQR